ncbi:MAG: tetratricopeptide repeat protein [Gemmatimonadetes bacterium]|nr:tetratricopeptide repeat protein [Gemmatimonadota bacterium]
MTIVCTLFGRLPGLHPGNRPLYSVQKMPVNQRGKTYPLDAVGFASFLVFANSLSNGLVYDDHFLIERNRLLREADVWGILTTHYWAGYEGEANINGQYRPLTVLSFMLDGLGGIWPFRFHLTNTILHVVNSLLAYLLCLNLGLKRGAILAALLFAVHPIHAEVVAGITFGRADLLAGLFSLTTLLLYIFWHNRGAEKYYGLALAGFFLALLSKESAIVLLGLVIAVDLTLSHGNGIRNLLWQRSVRWAGFIGIFVLYLTMRKVAAGLGFSAENILALNNPLIDQPLDHRLLTAAGLFWKYCILILFPIKLSVDYSYSAIPVITSILAPEATAGIILGIAGLLLWAGAFYKRWPCVFFALSLFFVPYSAVSQTLVLINAIFQERFLYIPVLGVFALFGLGFEHLEKQRKTVAIALAALILVAYSARTIIRNADWRDDLTLYQSAVTAYPESAKMQHALGDALSERGRISDAETAYRKALSIRESALTYNNLGNIYAATGRFKGATTAYQKAVEIEPDYIEAYMNKGLAAMQAEQITDAHSAFERAAILDPTNAEIFYNLGVVREKLGRPAHATTAYARAIALRPNWAEAYFNLGKAHRDNGEKTAAIQAYTRFIELWRGDPQVAQLARRELEKLNENPPSR